MRECISFSSNIITIKRVAFPKFLIFNFQFLIQIISCIFKTNVLIYSKRVEQESRKRIFAQREVPWLKAFSKTTFEVHL